MLRPDLVDVWVFRVIDPPGREGLAESREPAPPGPAGTDGAGLELYLMRRSGGRILPGMWQAVSGGLEPGESIVEGALRELAEETGIGPADIESLYHLDQVNQFYEPSMAAILTSTIFAVRVRPATEPVLSVEHDRGAWMSADAARGRVVWPAYRESIDRIEQVLQDPARAPWFELGLDGRRPSRPARPSSDRSRGARW